MQKARYANGPLRLMPVLPAPIARAGPEGLHSRPVLHNAHTKFGVAQANGGVPLGLNLARNSTASSVIVQDAASLGGGARARLPSSAPPRCRSRAAQAAQQDDPALGAR